MNKTITKLAEEVILREKRKGRDLNITAARSVLRHTFEILGEMGMEQATQFTQKYVAYYNNRKLKEKK